MNILNEYWKKQNIIPSNESDGFKYLLHSKYRVKTDDFNFDIHNGAIELGPNIFVVKTHGVVDIEIFHGYKPGDTVYHQPSRHLLKLFKAAVDALKRSNSHRKVSTPPAKVTATA